MVFSSPKNLKKKKKVAYTEPFITVRLPDIFEDYFWPKSYEPSSGKGKLNEVSRKKVQVISMKMIIPITTFSFADRIKELLLWELQCWVAVLLHAGLTCQQTETHLCNHWLIQQLPKTLTKCCVCVCGGGHLRKPHSYTVVAYICFFFDLYALFKKQGDSTNI